MTDEPTASRLRSLWARARRRSGDDRRDACGEPWMLGFGMTDAPAEASPALIGFPRPEPPAPPVAEHADALVGRDADALADRDASEEAALAADPFESIDSNPPGSGGEQRPLVEALHRVAASFERLADSLDADRHARRETFDDIDSLLRGLVGELRSPAAVAPVVLAGTIDTGDAARPLAPAEPAIDLAAAEAARDRRPFERVRRL